jgi:hypothetical protein
LKALDFSRAPKFKGSCNQSSFPQFAAQLNEVDGLQGEKGEKGAHSHNLPLNGYLKTFSQGRKGRKESSFPQFAAQLNEVDGLCLSRQKALIRLLNFISEKTCRGRTLLSLISDYSNIGSDYQYFKFVI